MSVAPEVRYFEHDFAMVADPNMAKPEVQLYCKFYFDCCQSYKQSVASDNMILRLAEFATVLMNKPIEQVRASAILGNPEDWLDLAIRTYAGCGTRKDEDAAAMIWMRLANTSLPGHIMNVSRSIRARAYSCLAFIHFERGFVDKVRRIWNIDSMYRAAQAADAAVALGLTSPAILYIGNTLERAQYRTEDPQYVRFHRLESLWEAVDKRTIEFDAHLNKQEVKIQRNPNAYRCAAPECGIEASSKSGLMRCAGPCSPGAKPAYCSKECQKKDWKHHKTVCKYGATVATPEAEANNEPQSNTGLPDTLELEHLSQNGKEYSVQIVDPSQPNMTTRISSKTLSATFLREARNETIKMLEERNADKDEVDARKV